MVDEEKTEVVAVVAVAIAVAVTAAVLRVVRDQETIARTDVGIDRDRVHVHDNGPDQENDVEEDVTREIAVEEEMGAVEMEEDVSVLRAYLFGVCPQTRPLIHFVLRFPAAKVTLKTFIFLWIITRSSQEALHLLSKFALYCNTFKKNKKKFNADAQ